MNQDNEIKGQRIAELQESIESMKRHVEMISEVLAANPAIEEVERAIARKRRSITLNEGKV